MGKTIPSAKGAIKGASLAAAIKCYFLSFGKIDKTSLWH